jgi:hypothetical protein
MFSKKSLIISLGLSFIITGCNSPKMLQLTQENSFINTQSALQIRDIQIRTFNNTTKENLSNAIVDTLLDDNYFVTLIDINAGVVSAKSSKDGSELNLVSIIRELSKDTYSVRFNINVIDTKQNSYTIVDDDLVYKYLFDRLRKSLFLEENLYTKAKNSEIKEPEKVQEIQNNVLVEEKLEEKVVSVVSTTSPIQEEKKEIKSTNLEKYTLQFVSAKEKQTALDDFNSLKNQGYDVRLEYIQGFHVVRVGRFITPNEASSVLNKLKKSYPDVLMVKLK